MNVDATGPRNYEMPPLNYSMGFSVNGTPIPDCSEFSGKESDLDTMGERDATGYLHRKKVATKWPLKLSYKAIPSEVADDICKLIRSDKFSFTWYNPYYSELQTMEAYVGDRDFTAVWWPEGGTKLVDLSFSIIQY